MLLCLKCGYHATTHLRALRQPCPGKRGAATDYVLRQAVTRKRHPVSGAFLHCSRILGTDWRADVSATAPRTNRRGQATAATSLGPRAKRRKVGHSSGIDPEPPTPPPWPLEDLQQELALLAQFEAEAAEGEAPFPLQGLPSASGGGPPPIIAGDEEVAADWWGSEGPLD
jgi:hypothetical protein